MNFNFINNKLLSISIDEKDDKNILDILTVFAKIQNKDLGDELTKINHPNLELNNILNLYLEILAFWNLKLSNLIILKLN